MLLGDLLHARAQSLGVRDIQRDNARRAAVGGIAGVFIGRLVWSSLEFVAGNVRSGGGESEFSPIFRCDVVHHREIHRFHVDPRKIDEVTLRVKLPRVAAAQEVARELARDGYRNGARLAGKIVERHLVDIRRSRAKPVHAIQNVPGGALKPCLRNVDIVSRDRQALDRLGGEHHAERVALCPARLEVGIAAVIYVVDRAREPGVAQLRREHRR